MNKMVKVCGRVKVVELQESCNGTGHECCCSAPRHYCSISTGLRGNNPALGVGSLIKIQKP
jgi:hypothetical protein